MMAHWAARDRALRFHGTVGLTDRRLRHSETRKALTPLRSRPALGDDCGSRRQELGAERRE
jgi:hypothetical protein